MVAVSVIIPCYNAATTIGPLVTSIRQQEGFTTTDEILVVDDHSTDNSPFFAQQAGANVVKTPTNAGPSAARNLGVATATHDVLFFLDADTLLEPGSLAVVKAHFTTPGAIPCLNGYCTPEPIIHDLARDYKGLVEYTWYLQAAAGARPLSCFNTRVGAMTRAAFDSAGGFDSRFRNASVEDYEFSYRLIRHHAIVLGEGLAVRHDHPGLRDTTRAYWDRTRKWLALFLERRRFDSGGTSSGNALGHLVGAACVVSGGLPFWRLELAVVPLGLLLLFLWLYRQFFTLALRRRGVGFFLGCLGLHLYYSLVIAAAAAVGLSTIPGGKQP